MVFVVCSKRTFMPMTKGTLERSRAIIFPYLFLTGFSVDGRFSVLLSASSHLFFSLIKIIIFSSLLLLTVVGFVLVHNFCYHCAEWHRLYIPDKNELQKLCGNKAMKIIGKPRSETNYNASLTHSITYSLCMWWIYRIDKKNNRNDFFLLRLLYLSKHFFSSLHTFFFSSIIIVKDSAVLFSQQIRLR